MATYTIKKGDNLSRIVNSLRDQGINTTVDELARLNNISNKNIIKAGATLQLPTSPTPQAVPQAVPQQAAAPAPVYSPPPTPAPQYQQSQSLIDAENSLKGYEATRPGEYQSQYGDQIQAMLDKILNREDFKYDFSADPMYQQYKDQYTQQGKLAMMDTMGQAAALTGGYGSSYGQSVGQQAYQGALGQLNNVIPELQNAAMGRYMMEGDKMSGDLGMLNTMDQKDYGQYRDSVGDWNTQYGQMISQMQNMSDDEWRKFVQDYNAWESGRNFDFQQGQAGLDEKWRQTQWDYNLAQDAAKGSGGGKSSSSGDLMDEINKMLAGGSGSSGGTGTATSYAGMSDKYTGKSGSNYYVNGVKVSKSVYDSHKSGKRPATTTAMYR